jgi:hypothetical protein
MAPFQEMLYPDKTKIIITGIKNQPLNQTSSSEYTYVRSVTQLKISNIMIYKLI